MAKTTTKLHADGGQRRDLQIGHSAAGASRAQTLPHWLLKALAGELDASFTTGRLIDPGFIGDAALFVLIDNMPLHRFTASPLHRFAASPACQSNGGSRVRI